MPETPAVHGWDLGIRTVEPLESRAVERREAHAVDGARQGVDDDRPVPGPTSFDGLGLTAPPDDELLLADVQRLPAPPVETLRPSIRCAIGLESVLTDRSVTTLRVPSEPPRVASIWNRRSEAATKPLSKGGVLRPTGRDVRDAAPVPAHLDGLARARAT